jgi:hypothetical protein
MTTIATSTTATKLRIATAACAVAAAATLVPLPAAQAAPAIPAPTWLGSTLGSIGCLVPVFDAGNCAAHAATIGNILYIGPVDTTPPTRTDFLTFNPTPLFALIPIIGIPLASWWASLNVEVCIGGLSARIGGGYPGQLTASIGAHC